MKAIEKRLCISSTMRVKICQVSAWFAMFWLWFHYFCGMIEKIHVEVYMADFVTLVFTEYIFFILYITMNYA